MPEPELNNDDRPLSHKIALEIITTTDRVLNNLKNVNLPNENEDESITMSFIDQNNILNVHVFDIVEGI